LIRNASSGGIASRLGSPPCTGITAALIPTLLTFGELNLVQRWRSRLLRAQLADGGFPQCGAGTSSLFNTAQALAALIELLEADLLAQPQSATRAAEYLHARLKAELENPCIDSESCGAHRWRAAVQFTVLPALLAAARRFNSPAWQRTVERMVARSRRVLDWHCWNGSTRLVAHVVDASIALGQRDLAMDILCWPSAAQRKNGSVPGDLRCTWGDDELLAHLAVLWYRLGQREHADRAMEFLQSQQLANGAWRQYWGRRLAGGESAWAVKHYLDAAWLQVTSSFVDVTKALPHTIDRRDGRFRAVYEWLSCLGTKPKVADVGCGPGRFLRALADDFPDARLVGIDPSPALLEHVSLEIETRRGGLLCIPAREGEFDGAFAVESLEHALLPDRAVSELCRVVRPGGLVLIIDKHSARQRLSLHEPWERWFMPEEIVGWLAPYCRDIRVRPIPHGADQETGLFLCWEATRAA
jgi:SAM-dependent methyltransferase